MTAPRRPPEPAESPERLKLFTDAVVAIALTLLILPLLETVPEAAKEHLSTQGWLRAHTELLFLFALSFLLIASLWTVHSRVFGHVEWLSGRLRVLNFVWMFAVVFLPVATALIGLSGAGGTPAALYVGTLLLGNLAMSAMVVVLARTPALVSPGRPLESRTSAPRCCMPWPWC